MRYIDIKDKVVYNTNRLWWLQYVVDYLPLGNYTRLKEYVRSHQYVRVPAIKCVTHASMENYSVHSVIVKGVPAFFFVLGGKRVHSYGVSYSYSNYYPLNLEACEDCVEHLVDTCMGSQLASKELLPTSQVAEDQEIEDLSNYCGIAVHYGKRTTNDTEVTA
jgi:hypothetical protein